MKFVSYVQPVGPFDGYYDGDYETSEAATCNLLSGIYDGAFETGDQLQVVENQTGRILWWHTVSALEDHR